MATSAMVRSMNQSLAMPAVALHPPDAGNASLPSWPSPLHRVPQHTRDVMPSPRLTMRDRLGDRLERTVIARHFARVVGECRSVHRFAVEPRDAHANRVTLGR